MAQNGRAGMAIQSAFTKGLLACLCCFFSASVVQAVDLTGAWANDASVCNKVFVKRGKAIAFAKDADSYGSGLIFEGNRIRGKIATCNVKSRKDDGDMLHLIGVCSTDVALQIVQLSMKIENENTVTRLFPGMPELRMPYSRCSL
jgi:uncharacterized cupredoxin-like copper-binding protein